MAKVKVWGNSSVAKSGSKEDLGTIHTQSVQIYRLAKTPIQIRSKLIFIGSKGHPGSQSLTCLCHLGDPWRKLAGSGSGTGPSSFASHTTVRQPPPSLRSYSGQEAKDTFLRPLQARADTVEFEGKAEQSRNLLRVSKGRSPPQEASGGGATENQRR